MTWEQSNIPPGRTVPQSCKVSDVKEPSLSTRTTPWLRPDNDSTPRPVAVVPGLPGLKQQQKKQPLYFYPLRNYNTEYIENKIWVLAIWYNNRS